MPNSNVKFRLQELLDRDGITMEELSEATGISQKKLQHVLDSHLDRVYMDTICDIADYFDVPISELFAF